MAVDFFLKLDSIPGEAVDDKHKDWIQVMGWSWGASQVTSVAGTGGSGAGKANLSDFSISKFTDKASTPIFKALTMGTHIKTGTLEAVKSGGAGKPFLKVDFQELYVTNHTLQGSSEIPMESVSFSYNQIKIEYSTQDEKGVITTAGSVTYNTKTNVTS